MASGNSRAGRAQYAAVAAGTLSGDPAGGRGGAEAVGDTPDDLASVPAGSNMGLSCGNPTAFASLRPGEVVVDLGSGGGLDVFLAAQKVGPTGRAIGIDMTPEMIVRARANAESAGYTNVEFYHSTIDSIPLPDSSVDCVISNCVINLAPDKPAVFREIFRILKPGGRVALSDIALKADLPEQLARSMAAYTGCIAGAVKIEEYRNGLFRAGFQHVEVVDSGSDLNAYKKVENQSSCCSGPQKQLTDLTASPAPSCCGGTPATVHTDLDALLTEFDVNSLAASVKVYALKPSGKTCCGPHCCDSPGV